MAQFPTGDELVKQWRYNLTNHTPTHEGIEKIEKVRKAAKLFAEVMIDNCPASRELSLALTSMEEATFHANSAIARNLTDDLKSNPTPSQEAQAAPADDSNAPVPSDDSDEQE